MSLQNADLNNHLNIEDTNTSLLYLMHVLDSAFPIGSYTHSFGMETYIQHDEIRTKEDLFRFCKSYICENLLYNDAIFVKESYLATKNKNWPQLLLLDEICDATKGASESREASRIIGKQFLQAILPVSSNQALQTLRNKLEKGEINGHFPIAYSIYIQGLGFSLELAILTYLYSSTISLVHNAVRAIPLGQQAGIEVIHRLFPVIEKTAILAQQKSLVDVSNHAIGLEIASMQHHFLHSRLFIS